MIDSINNQTWLVEVIVLPKAGVNDPEGAAIKGGLHSLGHDVVQRVQAGRYFELDVIACDAESAAEVASEMADQLLANPVIERFSVKVRERSPQ